MVDDFPPFLDAVAALLASECEVLGRAQDGAAALAAARRLDPDVIVMDVSMPVLGGLGAAERLRKDSSRAKIVFLTAYRDTEILLQCVKTGHCLVLKERMTKDLLRAIREALAGRSFVSPGVPGMLESQPDDLD